MANMVLNRHASVYGKPRSYWFLLGKHLTVPSHDPLFPTYWTPAVVRKAPDYNGTPTDAIVPLLAKALLGKRTSTFTSPFSESHFCFLTPPLFLKCHPPRLPPHLTPRQTII